MRVDLGNSVKLVFYEWTNYLMSLEVLLDKTMSSTLNK